MQFNFLFSGKAVLFRKQSLNIAGVTDVTHLGDLTAGKVVHLEAKTPPLSTLRPCS